MAETKLAPLSTQVPIVDKKGNPTPYFQQLMQIFIDEKNAVADDVITNLEDATVAINAVQGEVDALEDVVAALELDDLADVNTTGVADGDVLTYDTGSSEWVAAAPTGGGSGSDWLDLTFPSSTSTKWGDSVFTSNESITLAGGDILELMVAMDRDTGEQMSLTISPDTDNCYMLRIQTDNNYVMYSYDTSGGGSTVLSGGVVSQTFSGRHTLRFVIHVGKSGADKVIGYGNTIHGKESTTSNTNLRVSTNKVYLCVPNTTLSNLHWCKYRINSNETR